MRVLAWILGGAWALLLLASLVQRGSAISRQLPLTFADPAHRAEVRSGNPAYHRFLRKVKAAACDHPHVLLLIKAPADQGLFLFYRAGYELYPMKAYVLPARSFPQRAGPVVLPWDGPVARLINERRIRLVAHYSWAEPEHSSVFDVKGDESRRLVLEPRPPARPAAAPSRGASRPWAWPCGLASLLVLGLAVNAATGLSRPYRGDPATTWAFGLLTGSGLIAWGSLALAWAGLRLSLGLVLGIWTVAFAAASNIARVRGQPVFGGSPVSPLALLSRLGIGVVGLGMGIAVCQAVIPISAWSNWDTWAVWDLKVKAYWQAGGVPFDFLSDGHYGFSHPEYPPGIPAVQMYLALWSGGIGETLLRLLSPVWHLAGTVVLARLLRDLGLGHSRWLLAGLFSLTPLVLNQASNGYVDVAVGCAMTACLVLLLAVLRGELTVWPLAWMGGIAACLKNEGLIWGVGCLGVLGLWALARRLPWRPWVLALSLLAGLAAPWWVVTRGLDLSLRDIDFDFARMARNIPERLPLVVRAGFMETVGPGLSGQFLNRETSAGVGAWFEHLASSWLALWYAVGLAVLLGYRRLWAPPLREITLVLAFQICVCGAGYLASVLDVGWHLQTSLGRLMLQLAPAAWALACGVRIRGKEAPR